MPLPFMPLPFIFPFQACYCCYHFTSNQMSDASETDRIAAGQKVERKGRPCGGSQGATCLSVNIENRLMLALRPVYRKRVADAFDSL